MKNIELGRVVKIVFNISLALLVQNINLGINWKFYRSDNLKKKNHDSLWPSTHKVRIWKLIGSLVLRCGETSEKIHNSIFRVEI